MKIHLIANDGSPIGVTPPIIDGRGVGGAELAMMSLMRVLAKRGHEVTVYNDPDHPGTYDGVAYRALAEFITEHPRDILLIFRSPNPRVFHTRIPTKQRTIFWSTDQFTVGDFHQLGQRVDYVVTISPFHTNYHHAHYGIPLTKMGHIDIGVRAWEYENKDVIKKVANRLIYCSIPDRGLAELLRAWPQIKEKVPDASLVITSDYRLWGITNANNTKHRLAWMGQKDVSFLGRIPRKELIKHQLQAEILSYPCTYDELFCISAAECQIAGALPITSDRGALTTTNEFGQIIAGNPASDLWIELFSNRIIETLTADRESLQDKQARMQLGAERRFSYEKVAERWEELFERGKLA